MGLRRNRRSPHCAALSRKTFPRKVRGTADPSASLGMTKERATVSREWLLDLQGSCVVPENAGSRSRNRIVISTGVAVGLRPSQDEKKRLGTATVFYGAVALSFVIPGEAEGSAVPRTFRGNAFLESEAQRRDLRLSQSASKLRSED
jgi:hypothetical protein